MQDNDTSGRPVTLAAEPSNLPVPVPRQNDFLRGTGEGWFTRLLRALFRLNPGSVRAGLEDVLEADDGGTGFSPTESVMLRNILALRERRIVDVMVPRADIIA